MKALASRLLERICGLTVESVPADRCTIYSAERPPAGSVLAADCGPPAHPVACESHDLPASPVQEEFAAEQMIVLCRDHRMRRAIRHARRGSQCSVAVHLAVVPLRGRGGTIGAVTVGLQRSPCFDEDALETLRGVARHTATLIENAQLRSRLRKAAVVRGKLAEFAVRLGSRNDPKAIGRLRD